MMEYNEKRLHQAIEDRNEQLVASLIQNGVNLKTRNDRGMTCLHVAVEKSSLDIVEQLLKADQSLVNEVVHSSKLESNDNVGYTALHFSARYRKYKVSGLLLLHGAKVDVVDRNLRTPLHVAVLHKNIDGVKVMLGSNAPVNAEDCEGKTAFMCAVEFENVGIVKLMLSCANSNIGICKSYGKAIIEIANDLRCVEFVESLLQKFKYRQLYDEMLIEVLKCAVEKSRIYVIGKLLLSVNISLSLDESSKNTKTIATVDNVNKTNMKVAQLLMNYNNFIIQFVDLEAALHIAVVNGCNDIIKVYLQKGVNVDCKDNSGNPLLYMMCVMQNVDAAKKCVALGSDVNAKNYSGDTALHIAVRPVNRELISLLTENHCDLNAKNKKMETPFAVFLKYFNICYFKNPNLSSDGIENVMEVAKMLLKPGMDLMFLEKGSSCILHLAVKTGIVELVKLVIKYHPALDHLDKNNGQTCLHVAVDFNYIDVVKYLLELGANPDIYDNLKGWPISIAVELGRKEIINLLVSYSNLNVYRNSDNKTVMHLAAKRNDKEILSALVCAGVNMHLKDVYDRTLMSYVNADKCNSIYQHILDVGFDVNFGWHRGIYTCRCWSKCYTRELAKIHMLKLRFIKYDLKYPLLDLVEGAELKFRDVYFDISKEANCLSYSYIPDTRIPFTNIIKLDDKKLANYATNESVVKVFKDVDSLKMKWPHYWQILIGRMTKGFVRRRLLDKCYVIFNRVDGPKLRPECVKLIFDSLETSELHTFIVSFPKVDTSEYDDLWFIRS